MLDKLFAAIAFVGLVVFCGIIIVSVKIPDLIITIGLILFIAGHDLWISVFRPPGPVTEPAALNDLEARPTAVSGKPLAGPKDNYTPGG